MATLNEGWVLIYDNHDHDDETTIDREENSNVPQSLQKEFYDFHIALLVDVEVAREGTRPLLCWNDEERFLRQI